MPMDQSSPASYHPETDTVLEKACLLLTGKHEARPRYLRRQETSVSSGATGDSHSPLGAASPTLPRTRSGIDIPLGFYSGNGYDWLQTDFGMFDKEKTSTKGLGFWVFGNLSGGTRPMRRLLLMILLNVLYSTTELLIGLLSGRVGLVSDAFHLTFGCGLLTFSLFAMAMSRKKPDRVYTNGSKRLEVLAAFTNAVIFLGGRSSTCICSR